MAKIELHCPSCGHAHTFDGHVGFREECEACAADLHSCRACRFYDRYAAQECREPSAEYVANKERRNLCEWFQPGGAAGAVDASAAARAKLEAMFGGGGSPASTTSGGAPPPSVDADDPAAEAKRKLEALFAKKD